MGVLSILDREDLKVIYELVMEEYKDKLPEGFDKMLWGESMIISMALETGPSFVKQQLEEFEDSNDDDSVTSEIRRQKGFEVG
ncbi:hypothetical protein Tco_0241580 [Tanacetum coccineum]